MTEPEEAAGAAALRDLQWNWGSAYLITGVGAAWWPMMGRRADARRQRPGRSARADHRGLPCLPGLPRHRAGFPRLAQDVCACPGRCAQGRVSRLHRHLAPGRAAPLRSRGPGRWRPILPDQHRCDGNMARAAARPSVRDDHDVAPCLAARLGRLPATPAARRRACLPSWDTHPAARARLHLFRRRSGGPLASRCQCLDERPGPWWRSGDGETIWPAMDPGGAVRILSRL